MARIALGAATAASIILFCGPVYAVTCQGVQQPTTMDVCQTGWICAGDGWIERYATAGTACDDGNACTSGDVCNGGNVCSGTMQPPGAPAPINASPTTSTTGSYTISWSAATCSPTSYQVYEGGNPVYIGPNLSVGLSGRANGTYSYNAYACSNTGCSPATAPVSVTVLYPPAVPNLPQVHPDSDCSSQAALDTDPDYFVCWNAVPTAAGYDLEESTDNTSWSLLPSTGATYASFTGKAYGNYYYRVRACNASGCSAYTASNPSNVVQVITWLSSIQDPVIAPSQPVPPKPTGLSVGTLPGTPGVEGGAATYRLPIEIPPGRAGMQPEIALTYSSRSGNGIAGVGWAISGTSSIYRCPQTLAQDGQNRVVQHDVNDRFCFDGQRLVANVGWGGSLNSEYRTEVDSYARITQKGDNALSRTSFFVVELKDGRVRHYTPWPTTGTAVPDVWYLMREFDRHGNCMAYTYQDRGHRPYPEPYLAYIAYTGFATAQATTPVESWQCSIDDASARRVTFNLADRPDARTTYSFGVPSAMTGYLRSIQTSIGRPGDPSFQLVREYDLDYVTGVTGRSLLATVKLCAGPSCLGLPPTSFTYSTDADHFDLHHVQRNGVPLDTSWRFVRGADFDGDGKRDDIYIHDVANGEREALMSSCGPGGSPVSVVANSNAVGVGFEPPIDATRTLGYWDLDYDGRSDLFGRTASGALQYAQLGCAGMTSTPTDLSVSMASPTAGYVLAEAIDFDGDGIPDLRYWDPSSVEHVLRHRTTDPSKWAGQYDTVNPPALPNTTPAMVAQPPSDLNGDGLVDYMFEEERAGNGQEPQVAFFSGVGQGFRNPQTTAYPTIAQLGGPAGAFSDSRRRRWVDVNGDGLPDIYDPDSGRVFVNHGGPHDTPLFGFVGVAFVPGDEPLPNRTDYAMAMDVDNDGREELMVPRDRTISYCGGDKTHILPSGDYAFFCGDGFDQDVARPWRSQDHSVFQWDAYRFVENADGSYSLKRVPTTLQAPIQYQALAISDSNGDGLADVYFRLINSADDFYSGLATSDLGPYVARNLTRAPDLLISVTNGLGATAQWQHQPLSSADTRPGVNDVNGCDKPGGLPFYTPHLTDPRSPGYLFFTSSMWVVSRFDQDDGVDLTMNRTCYRYEDAMLNAQGRGFQGFKTIVAEEQLPPLPGEPPALSGYHCSGGGDCSANNLRTTTKFFQEFPLTSRLDTVTVSTLDGHALSETKYLWDAQYGAFTSGGSPRVVEVSGVGHVEKKFEPGGSQSSFAAAMSQFDATSGEPTAQCGISSGTSPSAQDVVVRDTRTLNNDTSNWLLGQITSRTVVSDFLGGTLPSATCQVSAPTALVPSACASIAPTCPSSASQAPKTRMTYYKWFAGTGLLQSETLIKPGTTPPAPPTDVPDADVESKVSYTYDAYGNVLTKQASARDAGTNATYPPPSNGLVAVGTTSYTLSADSYFVTVETNARGHNATTTTDPATGNVTYHQPIQGGAATTMDYDAIGRLFTSTTDGTQPVEQRVVSCAVGKCVLRRQVFQAGAPIKTEYVDRLGRVIATGTEGFDGKEVVTSIDFNARGAKIAEHQPISTGGAAGSWNGTVASPYMTQYSDIDALGRVAAKTVVRTSAAGFFEPGRGSANLVTNYAYAVVLAGIKTTITVFTPTAPSGQIVMSRSYDPRGKLVETVQNVSSPTAHSITTSYSYDSAGNLLVIKDSANNQLMALYDDLGRKKQVRDPDRGDWFYTWDGLGRVRTQQDARRITLAYQYDAIGRMERRFMLPADADPLTGWLLEANWQYDLNNKPGTLGAMRGVADTVHGTLTDTTKDWFHRDYKYDAFLRPWSITTHVPAESNAWAAQDLTIEYGYDRNYGRMKAMSSPSQNQELVAMDYDPRGIPIGETPLGADGKVPAGALPYRRVVSMSVRGQVAEQLFGNNVDETMTYDDSTGLATSIIADGLHEPSTACPTASAPMVRHLAYRYDHFLNLASQQRFAYQRDANGALVFSACAPIEVTAKETYDYDELQRLAQTSRSWTNLTPDAAAAAPTRYAYDDLGNIVTKSDYAQTYNYPPSGGTTYAAPGPHAVTSLSNGMIFSYDKNGNLTGSSGVDARSVTFDNLDRPIQIVKGTATTTFRYAPDGSRYVQRTSTGTSLYPKTVFYLDKLFERVVWNAVTEEKTYVGPATVIYRNGTTRDVRYLSLDRLGSTEAVTTASASEYVADQHSFDAFGKPRNGDFTTGTARLHSSDYNVTTEHGFTGHEHLDETYLIHMNGRVYDYQLGRFLSVDPIVSNPANSQSINPYSYIGNNPLSGMDPTGYMCVVGGKDDCENDNVDGDPHKRNDMVVARQQNSIGGRAGDNTSLGALDQDTIRSAMAGAGLTSADLPRNGGGKGQGAQAQTMNATDVGSPGNTARGADDYSPRLGEFGRMAALNRQLLKGLALEVTYGLVDLVGRITGDTPALGVSDAMAQERNPDFWTHPLAPALKEYGPTLFAAFVGSRIAPGEMSPTLEAPRAGPSFVVTPQGEAIRVPTGASGPTPTRAPGVEYTGGSGGHGLDSRVTGVRIMEGNSNQGSRAVYMNKMGQTVDPETGRTVPHADPRAHHYLKGFDFTQ